MPTRILRNDRPKGGLTQAGKRHDLKAVRWYVLTLPTAAGGRRDRISPSKGLDVELSRRERRGETLFGVRAGEYPLVEGGSGTHHVRLFYRDGGRGGDPAGRRS